MRTRAKNPVFFGRLAHTAALFFIALGSLFGCGLCCARGSPSQGTTTFALDGNRMYAELGFLRPDGSIHRALVFVDMGSPTMLLKEALFKELQLDEKRPLVFKLGGLSVQVPSAEVASESGQPHSLGSDLKIEGLLPAGILQRYRVVIDYRERTLTFARHGEANPQGVSVPFYINQTTGLIAVNASIAGHIYPLTIDNGSAYTWVSQSTATRWLVSNPDWQRGVGAVGASNMMMSADATEASGTLLRIPEISLGSLILTDVGALAVNSPKSFPGNLDLFGWYSQKNAVPVIGWVGGNILKGFRLTIDYPNRMTYWLKQSASDSHDLDQIGITLRSEGTMYVVAAIAAKNGKPAVKGVLPGDRLIRVGNLEMEKATWGEIYNAMHGNPGDTRSLALERNGNRLTVIVPVTAFFDRAGVERWQRGSRAGLNRCTPLENYRVTTERRPSSDSSRRARAQKINTEHNH